MIRLAALVYLFMSLVAIALYAADKRRAGRGEWRISEATLHLVELLGGWPGAIVAQHAMRHKTRKSGYLIVFRLIVAAHVALWTLAWRSGMLD